MPMVSLKLIWRVRREVWNLETFGCCGNKFREQVWMFVHVVAESRGGVEGRPGGTGTHTM